MAESAKKSVYLDATIPSFMFDERESLQFQCGMTRKWWREESPGYDVFTSAEAIVELSTGNYPRKKEVVHFASALRTLARTDAVIRIALEYIGHRVMPDDAAGDAAHLAYTSYYGIDFLLTWNCSHLANARKRKHIEAINARLGLITPAIITPLELFGGG